MSSVAAAGIRSQDSCKSDLALQCTGVPEENMSKLDLSVGFMAVKEEH